MEVNNTFGPIDIAISGLRAQGKQMEVISSNVANARTTDVGNGQPYRRLEAVFKANDDDIGGVSLDEVLPDRSEFLKIFDPSNPKADEQGYVYANVNSVLPNANSGISPSKNGPGDAKKLDFDNTVKAVEKYISRVDELQEASDTSIKDLLAGKNEDIVSVVSAVAKADMSFKLLVGVRNKLIEAYKQTMNMSV